MIIYFRKGFWNPSTFDSGCQQRCSFYFYIFILFLYKKGANYFTSKFLAYYLKPAAQSTG